jgi:hypothetical protein
MYLDPKYLSRGPCLFYEKMMEIRKMVEKKWKWRWRWKWRRGEERRGEERRAVYYPLSKLLFLLTDCFVDSNWLACLLDGRGILELLCGLEAP